jgi:haloalkane dehalogenase
MELLRTPEERFANLPGYGFAPHYLDVDGVRIHYVDEGNPAGAPILLLHGEPSWSYLYRTMIPPLVTAGYHLIAPDLVGFGRTDKPASREDYTYQRHVDWMRGVLLGLDLREVTLFCQDWGGLLGLRLVAEHEDRFARVVASNTFLPTGDIPAGMAFLRWRQASQEMPDFNAGQIVQRGTVSTLSDEVVAAYNAPFPDDSYLAGARQFPMLVPVTPDDPATIPNRRAWEMLGQWQKPFLCAFGDSDPITRGGYEALQAAIPGTQGQPHLLLENAGHFIQEDKGLELAQIVLDFIARTAQ